jgi:hypothetical protein
MQLDVSSEHVIVLSACSGWIQEHYKQQQTDRLQENNSKSGSLDADDELTLVQLPWNLASFCLAASLPAEDRPLPSATPQSHSSFHRIAQEEGFIPLGHQHSFHGDHDDDDDDDVGTGSSSRGNSSSSFGGSAHRYVPSIAFPEPVDLPAIEYFSQERFSTETEEHRAADDSDEMPPIPL